MFYEEFLNVYIGVDSFHNINITIWIYVHGIMYAVILKVS